MEAVQVASKSRIRHCDTNLSPQIRALLPPLRKKCFFNPSRKQAKMFTLTIQMLAPSRRSRWMLLNGVVDMVLDPAPKTPGLLGAEADATLNLKNRKNSDLLDIRKLEVFVATALNSPKPLRCTSTPMMMLWH